MLNDEVIAAVERGSFHLYAVRTLDEALNLVTGLESGERDSSGGYPRGTFNSLVDERLASSLTRGRNLRAKRS